MTLALADCPRPGNSGAMRALLVFVRSTLIGGILFLLPVGIVLVVFAKLLAGARRVGDALHARLFPGAPSDVLPLVFAFLALVALAFTAGMLARSRLGARAFAWLEGTILAHVPAYALVRQTVADMTGGTLRLTAGADTAVVLVRFDDVAQVGFLMERRPDGSAVVFLPDAPSALAGAVVIVAGERLTETGLAPAAVVQGMRRLGAGLFDGRGREAETRSAP